MSSEHRDLTMKFKFEKLGAIDEATVELAPLTVICGRNNTGKTYITYAIYALLSSWRQLIGWQVSDDDMRKLQSSGTVAIDMENQFASRWEEIRLKAGENWKDFLPQALAAPPERFKDTELSFDFDLNDRWIKRAFKKEYRSDKGRILFSAEKPENSPIIEFVALRDEDSKDFPRFALEDFVSQALLEAVLSPYIPTVFMVSTERTGAVAFKEELNLTKNKIVTLLTKMEAGKETHLHPGKLFEAVYKRGYPLPVESNVQFVNRFGSLEGRTGSFLDKHADLVTDFENIAGGRYETDKDGVTRFAPKGMSVKLQLSEASSAARSLVVFWYWLKTQASVGDMLLIDEPELNLHPENQRSFARLLAKLVNLGIQVLITTHSDTIIREFNTLIMFAQNAPHMDAVRKEFGYAPDESLAAESICLYVANGRPRTASGRARRNSFSTLERIPPDKKLGLSAEIFDATIIEMGKMQDALRYGAL